MWPNPVLFGHQQVGEPRCAVRLAGDHDHAAVTAASGVLLVLWQWFAYHTLTRITVTLGGGSSKRR